MARTSVFQSGKSLAVRIPRRINLALGEVEMLERGGEVVNRRSRDSLSDVSDLLASLPEDFLSVGRDDALPQRRRGL